MKIYIAGKITGLVYEEALRMFAAAEDELRRCGHEPVNPMKEVAKAAGPGVKLEAPNWNGCMRYLIPILLRCQAIYLLENWKDSKGARLEKHIAEELGMLIVTAGWQGKRGEIFPTCKDCGNVLDDNAGVYTCSKCRKALERLATESTESTEKNWPKFCGKCGTALDDLERHIESAVCFTCTKRLVDAASISVSSVSSVAKTI